MSSHLATAMRILAEHDTVREITTPDGWTVERIGTSPRDEWLEQLRRLDRIAATDRAIGVAIGDDASLDAIREASTKGEPSFELTAQREILRRVKAEQRIAELEHDLDRSQTSHRAARDRADKYEVDAARLEGELQDKRDEFAYALIERDRARTELDGSQRVILAASSRINAVARALDDLPSIADPEGATLADRCGQVVGSDIRDVLRRIADAVDPSLEAPAAP